MSATDQDITLGLWRVVVERLCSTRGEVDLVELTYRGSRRGFRT
jgi:hypothetical protein